MKQKTTIILALLFVVMAACSSKDDTSDEINKILPITPNINNISINQVICDPLSLPTTTQNITFDPADIGRGIKAELYYLNPKQKKFRSTAEYIVFGKKSKQIIFLQKIFIPTRLFNTGFPLITGGHVTNDLDDNLFEYFALKFSTKIHLGPGDDEGQYEFALLSDDGAVWKIKKADGTYQVLVNNDGNHPTQMGCSTQTINLKKNQFLDTIIEYYQGPKYHISLIPLWRRIENNRQNETYCGHRGNSLYFNYRHNSTPQQAYLSLLQKGWQPLNKYNYTLPDDINANPCVKGISPVISELKIHYLTGNKIKFTWTTDIPSTSQIKYHDSQTNKEILTISTNSFNTTHEVFIATIGDALSIQAISISKTYGKTIISIK